MKTILEHMQDRSMDKPYLFNIGQRVKPKKEVLDDGQTHCCWVKNYSKILERSRTMLSKENWYRLQNENGCIDDFKEYELDLRFKRGKN